MARTKADPSARSADAKSTAQTQPEQPPRCSDYAVAAWRRFQLLDVQPEPKAPSYPSISSIPRTPAGRLAQSDAAPTPFPTAPTTAPASGEHTQPGTLLYLAYGSNLAAETFLGRRGIRPLSQINVSAPSLRLVFDLPGVPYREPCFANTALRKIPGGPPKMPPGMPDIPDIPDIPDPPHHHAPRGGRDWDKGLIGVVYEVTPSDFAKIIATEGGGRSYHEILVPCIPLPPAVAVPEKPPIPELPKPFIARTLFAPRLPDIPDKGPGKEDDGDDGDKPDPPKPPSWFRKLLLPVRRPDPEYAQPSARYLKLITDGAREHDLPGEYQEYLQSLRPYTITTCRQQIGQILFLGFWAPLFLILMLGGQMLADKEGRTPAWIGAVMSVVFNLIWMSYDSVAKPLFGDGERTMEEDETLVTSRRRHRRGSSLWRQREPCDDEEKRCLLQSMLD
ncbi:hypothetical protein QBC47DRAFT_377259 [Echria macrotheca]|uniref:gamma-glutamylcyclotransferase n=1 Tax=Echria macrotheca TaxID=438768 RepID=A0AAJ0BH79_9PEZI|nr:hypothetical protein QBC47DRAFT_377259 [Echria macrotheca]